MSFKEDCVNALGEVGLGASGSVCLFREVQVGQFGPYLAVVDFFYGIQGLVWRSGVGGGSSM